MSTPLYIEIGEQILKEIEDKPINSPIASERELAEQFHASRMTVRNAVNKLVTEGFLYRNKTKGTFVADKNLLKKNTSKESLLSQEKVIYRLIYFNIEQIPDIASKLKLASDDPVLCAVRLLTQRKRPVTIEEIYFPYQQVQTTAMEELDKLLDLKQYAADGTITQQFIPMLVPPKYSNLLSLDMSTPIIMVDSLVRDIEGAPVVFIKAFHNPKEKVIEITS